MTDKGNYLETILTLYFMILHEFYPKKYSDLLDFKKKESNFYKALSENNINTQKQQITQKVLSNIGDKPFSNIMSQDFGKKFNSFSFALSPNNPIELSSSSFRSDLFKTFIVENEDVDYRFVTYLLSYPDVLSLNTGFSECTLNKLKKVIKNIL